MSQAHKKSHEVWFKDNFFFALADSFYCVFFFFFNFNVCLYGLLTSSFFLKLWESESFN